MEESLLVLEENPVFHFIGILCPEEEQNVGIEFNEFNLESKFASNMEV